MKTDKLMDAVTELSDEVLNEAAGAPSPEDLKAAKAARLRRIVFSAAAAAAVAVLAFLVIPVFGGKNSPKSSKDGLITVSSADAQTIAKPEYPEEWSHEKEENSVASVVSRPWYIRQTAGREAADIYRSFFADTMLLLLSDEDEKSAAMSPVNLFMATAMLAEITDGGTRQEILDALGVKNIAQLREQAAKIWGLCYKDDGQEKTLLGNSLWLNNSLAYRESTVGRLADSYYASSYIGEMGSVAYNKLLQTWISDMTGGLLAEQTKGIELSTDTALALVSTIWHETKWDDEFLPDETKPGTFHAPDGDITVDMMHSDWAGIEYFSADHYKFINKPTRQGNVWLFLPDEGTSVQEMMQEDSFRQFISHRIDHDDYFGLTSDGVYFEGKTTRGITGAFARVRLTVPKLDISCQQDLTDAMQKLGIRTAFDSAGADYSPITDQSGVYLAQAVQGTRLIMDEEGVSAASYVLMLAGAPMVDEEIDFVFDRPFFMMVTGPSEVPLFAAVVNVP